MTTPLTLTLDPEVSFLRARAAAHAAQRGVSLHVHHAFCDCGKADTACDVCGRDDFERPGETLTFEGGRYVCVDCREEAAARAAEAAEWAHAAE